MGLKLFVAKMSLGMNGFNIDSITDGLGMKIESEIKPLVLALNYRGYPTSMSCGGHSLLEREQRMQYRVDAGEAKIIYRAERGLVYEINDEHGKRVQTFNDTPWVHIESDEDRIKPLKGLIDTHNSGGIVWDFYKLGNEGTYRLETLPRYDLTGMREDSKVLANEILRSDKL